MKNWKFLLCALAAIALAVGAVACGDDDDDSTATDSAVTTTEASTDTATIDVSGSEYAFDLSATPTADTTEITFTNDGEEDHDMIVAKINEGYTLDEAFAAEGKKGTAEDIGATFAKPGETAKPVELKQPLEPGHYGIVCTLQTPDGESHYDLGMHQEFDIEG